MNSIRNDNESASLHIKIGKCNDRKREYAESVTYYQKAVSIEPKNTNANFKLGWAQFREGSDKVKGLDNMRAALDMPEGMDQS